MLPKITHPIHLIKVPSLNKKIQFRPFLVKEEKLLLMSKTSDDKTDILRALKQTINNCCIDDINVNELTIFDIEYIFLQLRAISVNNIATVAYKDNEDNEIRQFEIDLLEIDVNVPENNNVIKINETEGIIMKYPKASIFEDKEYLQSGDEAFYELILRCIDKVYNEEEVITLDLLTQRKEIEEFLENLDVATYKKMVSFLEKTPKLYYKITYVNNNGKERIIELKSLADFFSLG